MAEFLISQTINLLNIKTKSHCEASMKKLYYAIATIIGAVIGAGVLGIPFAFARAGIVYGLINLAAVAVLVLVVNLYLGEVMLRTNGVHQLTGYAEKYLGKWGKGFMAFSLIFGIYGALIAYLLGIGDIMSALLGGQPIFYMSAFFIIFSALIYAGIKAVSKSEFLFSYIKIAVFVALAISMVAFFKLSNLQAAQFSIKTSLIPYGVVLFSIMAFPSLPEAREIMKGEEKSLRKVIMVSTLLPAIIYAIFAVVFIGVLGVGVGEVAIVTLSSLGIAQFILGFAFAALSMMTAYLSLGLALQEMYEYDYKISHGVAFTATCLVPFVLILLGVKGFVAILGLVGAVAGGIDGIIIILMFHLAKKHGDRHPEYSMKKYWLLSAILLILFAAGIIYEVVAVI
jgi:amino acid permease